MVERTKTERRGWRFAMEAARRAGNAEALEPGKFFLSLVRFARPIAEKVGSGEHLDTAW